MFIKLRFGSRLKKFGNHCFYLVFSSQLLSWKIKILPLWRALLPEIRKAMDLYKGQHNVEWQKTRAKAFLSWSA